MNLEQQVTSVELSNKLHILGVTAPSMFYRKWQGAKEDEIEINKTPDYCPDTVNCYTVAELGEMLPSGIDTKEGTYRISIVNGNGIKFIDYTKWKDGVGTLLYGYPMIDANTEADARAKMLCYLLENKLLQTNTEDK